MKLYQVEAVSVAINTGVLELSLGQAQRRRHLLKQISENQYEVLSPVQFKRGETFGYSGDVNKSLMTEMAFTGISDATDEPSTPHARGGKGARGGKK